MIKSRTNNRKVKNNGLKYEIKYLRKAIGQNINRRDEISQCSVRKQGSAEGMFKKREISFQGLVRQDIGY